jgi:hypothetical protein
MPLCTTRCLNLFAHVTQAAQFVRTIAAEDPGLALARFVPIHGPMFSKGTTWPPGAPARARALSGSVTPPIADRPESSRAQPESTATAHGDGRTTEPHWESVTDRATD